MDWPDDSYERPLWAKGLRVAGVDEVGRGPLAGPVVAAAVVLNPECVPPGMNDSKKMSARRRWRRAAWLKECAEVGIGWATVDEIDQINILQASLLAMHRALTNLPHRPDHALIDGRFLPPQLPCPATPLIKGDGLSVSIAAASIVAKTWRDRHMRALAQQHPGYGWETNAGYGSKSHKAALSELGVTPHHRRSFKPIHNSLWQDESASD